MSAESPPPAVAEFFQEERGRLVGFVRGWLDDIAAEEAEDIVQDVVLNLFDRADITAPIRDLSAYVYRALKNRIVDYFRRKRSSVSLDQSRSDEEEPVLADLLRDNAISLQSELERKEIHAQLYRALDALPPEDRAIILATEFEGASFRDLAEEWEAPLGTLLARKARALKKIRKQLEASGKFIREGA
jgi:RNA polymerase sigma factor (sigma-70 family)